MNDTGNERIDDENSNSQCDSSPSDSRFKTPSRIAKESTLSRKSRRLANNCENRCSDKTPRKKLSAQIEKTKNAKQTRRMSGQITDRVRSHILSFPLYQYHHIVTGTTLRYFHADLTLKKMFDQYLDLYPKTEISFTLQYVEIFQTLKIKFKKPYQDSCYRCEDLKTNIYTARFAGLLNLKALEDELRQHEQTVQHEETSKKKDAELSSTSDGSVKTFAFALQKCLPTPLLRSPESYCKRLLWTFNLTVHDCVDGNPYCFMWHEGMACRGGNQVASCILKYLSQLDKSGRNLHRVIFYSTKLLGQKTNSAMAAMFSVFLRSSSQIEIIDHKFLEAGHSHSKCDVDLALIEQKKCKAKIHHPRDWYNFAGTVGMKPNLKVVEMMGHDFKDFATIPNGKMLRDGKNQGCERFEWIKVKWLRYDKNSMDKLQYKCSLIEEEPFETIPLQKVKLKSMSLDTIPIIGDKVSISLQKKTDLMSLLPLIDPEFHDFYKNLPAEDRPDTHPDLVDGFDEAEYY